MFVTAFLKFVTPLTSLSEAKLYDGSVTEDDGYVFEEVVKWPDLGVFNLTLNNDAKGMCWFSSIGYLWHQFQYNHAFDMYCIVIVYLRIFPDESCLCQFCDGCRTMSRMIQ